jgi:hypothetical protein
MKRLIDTKGLYIESEILWNDGFRKLTASEIHIYFVFKMKCRIVYTKESKKTKVPVGTIKNNGQIIFPYEDAPKIGFSEATFKRAIDHLVELGFLDIARPGALYRPTLYSISERWRKYGTPQFQKKERPKRTNNTGFKKGEKQNPHNQK